MGEWSCEWQGTHVAVKNRTKWFRTGERLFVGNMLVDANEAWVWSGMSGYLAAPVTVRDNRHLVEAVIGPGQRKVRTCCKIFLDGQPIGGDAEVTLALPDVSALAKRREQGLARFLTSTGLLHYGLPYAIVAGGLSVAFERGRSFVGTAIQWALAGILFGLGMGVLDWRTAEATLRVRQSKHDQPQVELANNGVHRPPK